MLSELIASLEGLSLEGGSLSLAELKGLCQKPLFAPLRSLEVWDSRLPPASALKALANAPQLASLRAFLWSKIPPAFVVDEMLASPALPALRDNHLGDAGAALLAASPRLEGLTSLSLRRADLGVGAARPRGLAVPSEPTGARPQREPAPGRVGRGAPRAVARGLRSLDLTGAGLDDAGLAALAGSPDAPSPLVLRLSRNAFGRAGLRALVASPLLACVAELGLDRLPLGPGGAAALFDAPHLARVISLDLGFDQLGDEDTRALAACPHLGALRELCLTGNQLGDESARLLVASTALPSLRSPALGHNLIGNEGAQALASCVRVAQLRDLSLRKNKIGARGLQAPRASPYVAALRELGRGYLRRPTDRVTWI